MFVDGSTCVLEFAVLSAKASSFKWTLQGKLLCAVDEQICKSAECVGCMWMLWIFVASNQQALGDGSSWL